jgi:CheY-like chemotaxis protein
MATQPKAKKIFVLEDEAEQLETYIKFLNGRGFSVKGAKNLDEVADVLHSDERFDLLLLDMNLKLDPRALESNLSGSDIGKQLIKRQTAWPPEVLTMTTFEENIDYWRKSFALGAAALLEKRAMRVEVMIDYVCVLLLRRAFSLNNPGCKEAVEEMLKGGRREDQVLGHFMRQFVLPEFDTCLGLPVLLVLECGRTPGEEETAARHAPDRAGTLKEKITELVTKASYYAQTNAIEEPIRLDEEIFQLAALPTPRSAYQFFFSASLEEPLEIEEFPDHALTGWLADAALIFLPLTPTIRLSLFILKDKNLSASPGDSLPLDLTKLLAAYALDPLRMTLTNLVERWKRAQEIKRVQLQELARFCQYVGAEAKRLTYQAEVEGRTPECSTSFRRLVLLTDELSESGNFLSDLGQESPSLPQRLILQEVIQEAWDSLKRSEVSPSGGLVFQGECQAAVMCVKEELLFLFSRLLHWLVSFYEENPESPPRINVACRLEGAHVELSFESDSLRLHKILRDSLFVPMTQRINYEQVLESKGPRLFLALYVAKTILEKKYKGSLTDRSDELPENLGHKLVIRMPVINQ